MRGRAGTETQDGGRLETGQSVTEGTGSRGEENHGNVSGFRDNPEQVGEHGFCTEAASGARPPGRPAGEGAACPPGGGSADDQRGSVPFRVNSSGGHCQAQRRKTELNISIFKCMN